MYEVGSHLNCDASFFTFDDVTPREQILLYGIVVTCVKGTSGPLESKAITLDRLVRIPLYKGKNLVDFTVRAVSCRVLLAQYA